MPVLKENTVSKNLYSFDIFDTLITRRTATPAGIFYLMQEILANNKDYSEYFRENFKTIRCETQAFVRENLHRTKQWQEISFNDIYNRIQINHSLTDKETEFLKELEIKCEIENLIPIEENIIKLKKLVSSGNEVILISDMYHSEDTIRKFLTNIDPVFKNIKIYVSSEYRKSKAKGDLYKYIKTEYNPSKWEHFGDNICADYSSAKKNKISPYLYKYVNLKGYEKAALKENNITTEYLIGTAKNLRLRSNNEKYNFGASFAGPILYQYVNWILSSSIKKGTKHLYFIARDGYIPKLIADLIIKENNIPIKTHYIYGSRKAWRIPFDKSIDEYIQTVFQGYYEKFSGKYIAENFSLTKEELKKFTGIQYNNKILSGKARKNLFKKLSNNIDFKSFIIQKYSSEYNLILKYLKQEINQNKNFAFVDLNGTGMTQDILAEILSTFCSEPVETFYFCMNLKDSNSENSIKRVFVCSEKYKHSWLELLCRNTDGQTIGYKEELSGIKPVFEIINPEKLIKWGYNDYIKGILDFTSEFLRIQNHVNHLNNINFYYSYFNFVINNIDKETADILGSIPYKSVGNETSINECAPAYNILSLAKTLLNSKYDADNFIFISKERSAKIIKSIINIKIKYKSLRKYLFDIHIHKKKNEAYICIMGMIIDLHKFGYKE